MRQPSWTLQRSQPCSCSWTLPLQRSCTLQHTQSCSCDAPATPPNAATLITTLLDAATYPILLLGRSCIAPGRCNAPDPAPATLWAMPLDAAMYQIDSCNAPVTLPSGAAQLALPLRRSGQHSWTLAETRLYRIRPGCVLNLLLGIGLHSKSPRSPLAATTTTSLCQMDPTPFVCPQPPKRFTIESDPFSSVALIMEIDLPCIVCHQMTSLWWKSICSLAYPALDVKIDLTQNRLSPALVDLRSRNSFAHIVCRQLTQLH